MTEYLYASNFTDSGPQLVPVKVVRATDYDARAAELATTSELRPSWNFAWVTDRTPHLALPDSGGVES